VVFKLKLLEIYKLNILNIAFPAKINAVSSRIKLNEERVI
jgi:hypothetical protein